MTKMLILLPILILSQKLWAGGNTGGMDGGGGGTLPAQPAYPFQIQEIAQEAKPQLLYLLNYYEWINRSSQHEPLYIKLFGGNRKAQHVLKDLRLEVREDKPCFTFDGKEVDASIHAIKPNTICLSSYRIASKVDKATAEREVLALLIHEVSHFMSATEVEAVELQQDISWAILNAKDIDPLNGRKLRAELDHFRSLLNSSIEALNQLNLPKANEQLKQSRIKLTQWTDLTVSYPYRLLEEREEQYQDLLRFKLVWANKYLEPKSLLKIKAGPLINTMKSLRAVISL